jgi:hypothetical protein
MPGIIHPAERRFAPKTPITGHGLGIRAKQSICKSIESGVQGPGRVPFGCRGVQGPAAALPLGAVARSPTNLRHAAPFC